MSDGALKRRARVNIDHGPAKFLLLRQPGYPANSGPVAFRPTITRGLALSAIYLHKPFSLLILLAILVPKRDLMIKSVDFYQDYLKIEIL
jgi:hypothetical protein